MPRRFGFHLYMMLKVGQLFYLRRLKQAMQQADSLFNTSEPKSSNDL